MRVMGVAVLALIPVSGIVAATPAGGGAQQRDMVATVAVDPQGQQGTTDKRISLSVADSTVAYVIRAIARQANLRISYDNSDTLFQQRIAVRVNNANVRTAFATALRETGLVATFTADGETVVIRRAATAPRGTAAADTVATARLRGRVIDSITGDPLPGVTVTADGGRKVVTSTANGDFVFPALAVGDQAIQIRALGYEVRQVRVTVTADGDASLLIRLQQGSRTLSEVVTTATGVQRRVEVANDVARVDAEEIMRTSPVRSLTDLIAAAHVPGVQVTPSSGEPGAPARIRIRGIGSITQNNDPVVIVDGRWINAPTSTDGIQRQNAAAGNGLLPSALDEIDPATIETMEIVRGPSAATLYGQDAANGVIIITTKRGKSGPTRWDFNYSRDWDDVPGSLPPLYQGYGRSTFSDQVLECPIVSVLSGVCTQDSVISLQRNDPFLSNEGNGHVSVWRGAVSGGTATLRYNLTGTYQDQLGARRLAGVQRVRLRQLGIPVSGKFLTPSQNTQKSITSVFDMNPTEALQIGLNFTARQTEDRRNGMNLSYLAGTIDPRDTVYAANRVREVRPVDNTVSRTTGELGGTAIWNPLSWWRNDLTLGVQRQVTRESDIDRPYACANGSCALTTDTRDGRQQELSTYTVRVRSLPSYNAGRINRFLSIIPAFGVDFRKTDASTLSVRELPGSSGSMNPNTTGTLLQTTVATAGWYIDARIGLFDRLFFNTGLRQDVGSAITASSNTTYPKLGTSWIVSEEGFFPKTPWLTVLTLRGALGHAAKQPEAGDIYGQYVTNQVNIDGRVVEFFQQQRIGNPRLEPERSTEVEFGFDAEMLHRRVTLYVTGFHKENRNNLIQRRIAPSGGVATSRLENVARVWNRGFNLELNAILIDRPDVFFEVGTGMDWLDNEVARLGSGVTPFGENDARIVEGYPVNGLWVRPVIGYFDTNGDGLLSDSEIVLGDTTVYAGWVQPRYSASYRARLSLYNRLTFTTTFAYQGAYTQNIRNYDGLGRQDVNAALAEQAIARVTGSPASRTGLVQTISDLRWGDASLRYDFPQNVLTRLKARALSVTLLGRNLGLWTSYRGRDPGVNSTPIGDLLQDNGSVLPMTRKYSLSFQWGF